MSDFTMDSIPQTDAEYEAGFNAFLAEIKQHEITLDKYHAEIAQVWTEARAIGAQTDSILAATEQQLNAMKERG